MDAAPASPDGNRTHLPFSTLWRMRIEHPYSLFLGCGDYGWSCGQCPLDADGQVLFAGELAHQQDVVLACRAHPR